MTGTKITMTPAFEALVRFDQENNVLPQREIAESIADGYGLSAAVRMSLVDEISSAIEDAREIGRKRAALEIECQRKKGQ